MVNMLVLIKRYKLVIIELCLCIVINENKSQNVMVLASVPALSCRLGHVSYNHAFGALTIVVSNRAFGALLLTLQKV